MYIKKKYSIKDMVLWTRWEIYGFTVLAVIPLVLFEVVGLEWMQLPWTPIALIGTAVAFLIGFQNSAAYGRIWEARKIWGGIVNASRSWGIKVLDMVTNEHAVHPAEEEQLYEEKRILIHRHIAWLTALRYAMRQPRPWEVFREHWTSREWLEMMHVPETESSMEDELKPLLSEQEFHRVMKKTNRAAAILTLQSHHLRTLKEQGFIWEFSFLEMEIVLAELIGLQGKSERIKNFPYPRQYATLSYDFVRIFVILLPFGVIPVFSNSGNALAESFPIVGSYFVWAAIPFTVIVSWIFNTMQRIGTVGENPFEGSANDVPISTIARGIEIDLREMMDESPDSIPDPIPARYGVQM